MRKFEWGEENSVTLEEMKKAIVNITQVNYYDPSKDTRGKCDASHSGRGASLKQKLGDEDWVHISFASQYLNVQEKNTRQMNWNCLQRCGWWIGLKITCWAKSS